MNGDRSAARGRAPGALGLEDLLARYGCGPIQFTGTNDALYERHLMFDNVVDPTATGSSRAALRRSSHRLPVFTSPTMTALS